MQHGFNHIFDVTGNDASQSLRGMLDVNSKEIVIYDDNKGHELFRIGNNGEAASVQPKYKKGVIAIVVKNASSQQQTATLFAANREPLIQPLGITVHVQGLDALMSDSHNYIRRDILSNSFKIINLRYQVSDIAQFNNLIEVNYINQFGQKKHSSFKPYINERQFQDNIIDLPNFKGVIDGKTEILVPIIANSTCTLYFECLVKVTDTDETQNNALKSTKPNREKISELENIYSLDNAISYTENNFSNVAGNKSQPAKFNLNKTLITVVLIGIVSAQCYMYYKYLKKNG